MRRCTSAITFARGVVWSVPYNRRSVTDRSTSKVPSATCALILPQRLIVMLGGVAVRRQPKDAFPWPSSTAHPLRCALRSSCAPGFPWTLDCERVLAGGVSKWGSQIKVRRRRREPGGRPEMLPGTAVGDGFRPGASARRCGVCCAARILSPCRGSWGSRRRGPRRGGISFWPQARPA